MLMLCAPLKKRKNYKKIYFYIQVINLTCFKKAIGYFRNGHFLNNYLKMLLIADVRNNINLHILGLKKCYVIDKLFHMSENRFYFKLLNWLKSQIPK